MPKDGTVSTLPGCHAIAGLADNEPEVRGPRDRQLPARYRDDGKGRASCKATVTCPALYA